jgi:hypothetical protein
MPASIRGVIIADPHSGPFCGASIDENSLVGLILEKAFKNKSILAVLKKRLHV